MKIKVRNKITSAGVPRDDAGLRKIFAPRRIYDQARCSFKGDLEPVVF